MAVASCEAAGIPYSVVNIYAGESTRQSDTALAANLAALSTVNNLDGICRVFDHAV